MALWTMTDEAAGKPKYLSDELRNTQTVSDKDATIGINAAEAADADSAAKGLTTPGWVNYVTYTDSNGNVRHKSEVLVASGSMASDGTETLTDDLGGGGFAGTAYTMGTEFTGSIFVLSGNEDGQGYIRVESNTGSPNFAPADMDADFFAAIGTLTVGTQFGISANVGGTVYTGVYEFVSKTGDIQRTDIYYDFVSGQEIPASYSPTDVVVTIA